MRHLLAAITRSMIVGSNFPIVLFLFPKPSFPNIPKTSFSNSVFGSYSQIHIFQHPYSNRHSKTLHFQHLDSNSHSNASFSNIHSQQQLTKLIDAKGFMPEQVFNTDETGLFQKRMPYLIPSSPSRNDRGSRSGDLGLFYPSPLSQCCRRLHKANTAFLIAESLSPFLLPPSNSIIPSQVLWFLFTAEYSVST